MYGLEPRYLVLCVFHVSLTEQQFYLLRPLNDHFDAVTACFTYRSRYVLDYEGVLRDFTSPPDQRWYVVSSSVQEFFIVSPGSRNISLVLDCVIYNVARIRRKSYQGDNTDKYGADGEDKR